MNKMTLEQLAKKTSLIHKVGKALNDFYGNKPPYFELIYTRISFMYLMSKAGGRIEEIKLRILR